MAVTIPTVPRSKPGHKPTRVAQEPGLTRTRLESSQVGQPAPQDATESASEELLSSLVSPWAAPLRSSGHGAATALHDILFRRYLATVRDLVMHLSEKAVRRALEQNTGLESLAVGIGERVVAAAVASESAQERSERILDLHRAQASLLDQSGGAVTAIKAAELLGKTRQAVEKRRERGTLLAVMAAGEYLDPLFQFDSPAVLVGLPEVLKAFTVRNGWTQLSVLLSPQDALDGRSVVDALKQGDVEGAVSVAATFGDTGG